MRTVVAFTMLFVFFLASLGEAQDLQVVKDSEAAQYVGKNVEVRGLVVAVYTSKKGNTFLNFGGKYPNQTFTGWIPAESELAGDRWTVTLGGKVIGITGTIELYCQTQSYLRIGQRYLRMKANSLSLKCIWHAS